MTDTERIGSEAHLTTKNRTIETAPRVQAFLLKYSARADGHVAADDWRDRDTLYLERPTGRVAYSLSGVGPLVICIPGMGDVRSVYRFLAPALAEAGFQVVTMDLRGHGDSDVTFDRYDDIGAASDLIALTEQLGGPAILVGNSMGAGAVCLAAAQAAALTAGLVLLGPFVRDRKGNILGKLMLRLALLRPWGPAAWNAYFKKLYPTRRDAEYEAHFAEVAENLHRPGHWDAFHKTTRTSHNAAEAILGKVHVPTLIVMGDKDPDFPDPEHEARWIAERLRGKVLMVPGAGHYPQAEFPEVVSPAVVEFARRIALPVA
jgi:pimeloyl-ACP methyl ester carboxylesterase